MFRGIVERPSHENGLLVSFTGSSPALGSRLIDGGGRVVGIVDTVLGHVEEPMLHMKLKLDADPAQIIGLHLEVQSRQSGWDDRKRDGRGRSNERRGHDRRGGRDSRGGDRRGNGGSRQGPSSRGPRRGDDRQNKGRAQSRSGRVFKDRKQGKNSRHYHSQRNPRNPFDEDR